jgi:2-polyprenyl-3-methyl-5-hydroxy-6-metoxy-1,4-benzoquinol methylase
MSAARGEARHRVLIEEEAWDHAARRFLGPHSQLISVSRWIGDSRVYRKGDRLATIRSLETANRPSTNSLRFEANVLERLGWPAEYVTSGRWEALRVSPIPGFPLEQDVLKLPLSARVRLLVKLIPELRELHKKQVAHRDLRPDNIVVEPTGRPRLIDFDRAIISDGFTPALADWLGICANGLSPNPYWKFALFTLVPKVQTVSRRVRNQVRRITRPQRIAPSDPDLVLAHRAWQIAEQSNANAPGQGLAYYALTYKNWHFRGERPWYYRWEAIRRGVSMDGKRVLDLGTNVGLLPVFSLIHSAKTATGVDSDARILEAAEMVARAFDVTPTYRRVDFDRDENWEADLEGADLVFAMSVLQWLKNEDRLLQFLANHAEVVYEGHESLEVEQRRLGQLGFRVHVLTQTERGRFLLYGSKARD